MTSVVTGRPICVQVLLFVLRCVFTYDTMGCLPGAGVYIMFACILLLDMNLTLPELTLFMKQESHGWSSLNS